MRVLFKALTVILSLGFILASCGTPLVGDDYTDTETEAVTSETETEKETESDTQPIAVNFKVIYPENCEGYLEALSIKVKNEINQNTNTKRKVTVRSDRVVAGEYEILLGDTNRVESEQGDVSVGNAGWWVRSYGSVIAINAKSRKGLTEAVGYFLENYRMEDDGMIYLEGEPLKTEYGHDALYENGPSLRVGSYNIKHGEMVGLDMSVLAEDIKALDLDIVGLQEVDVCTGRVGGRDTLKELAESAGYEYYYFCKAIDYQGGGYGTAILSRYPIKSFETVHLYTDEGMERRAVGHAVIDVNGVDVDYFNTHLSYESTDVVAKQFAELNELVKDKEIFIITADFNTSYSLYFQKIEDTARVNHDRYYTFPDGMSAIDDIVISFGWSIKDSGYVKSDHSDHYMLWAELSYDGGMNRT